MSLLLGDTAPNFQIDSQKGKIDFHEFIGDSWVFFFSHPADWKVGDRVIIPPSVTNEEAKEKFPQGFEEVRSYLRFTSVK